MYYVTCIQVNTGFNLTIGVKLKLLKKQFNNFISGIYLFLSIIIYTYNNVYKILTENISFKFIYKSRQKQTDLRITQVI